MKDENIGNYLTDDGGEKYWLWGLDKKTNGDWQKEFEEGWERLIGEGRVEEIQMNFCKSFISKLLAERDQELIKELEGMEMNIKYFDNDPFHPVATYKAGYNRAVSDFINKIKQKE